MTTQLVEKRLAPELMIQDLDAFMAKIEEFASLLKLDLSFAQADHIALRINDTDTAKAAHEAWIQHGKVISQAKINGRPIIVIEFDKALESRGWKIECLELPYPAEGKIYQLKAGNMWSL